MIYRKVNKGILTYCTWRQDIYKGKTFRLISEITNLGDEIGFYFWKCSREWTQVGHLTSPFLTGFAYKMKVIVLWIFRNIMLTDYLTTFKVLMLKSIIKILFPLYYFPFPPHGGMLETCISSNYLKTVCCMLFPNSCHILTESFPFYSISFTVCVSAKCCAVGAFCRLC